MRIDARPYVGRRLAAIIKSRPHEAAAQPRTVGEITPPSLGGVRPRRRIVVVGADVTAHLVVLVNAARADGAGLFRADLRLRWMSGVIAVHLASDMIIPAAHFDDA